MESVCVAVCVPGSVWASALNRRSPRRKKEEELRGWRGNAASWNTRGPRRGKHPCVSKEAREVAERNISRTCPVNSGQTYLKNGNNWQQRQTQRPPLTGNSSQHFTLLALAAESDYLEFQNTIFISWAAPFMATILGLSFVGHLISSITNTIHHFDINSTKSTLTWLKLHCILTHIRSLLKKLRWLWLMEFSCNIFSIFFR